MVPLFDSKKEYQEIKTEINAKLNQVGESGWFLLGNELEALEKEMATRCGVEFAIGVHSGTDAIRLAIESCGIGEGDEVITTPLTAVYTAYAIIATGAKPVLVDIEESTLGIDPKKVNAKITPQTKAIIPVHLHGKPCRIKEIKEICDTKNLVLIEDCAQAIEAKYHDQFVGTFGKVGCFSFYPTKNLGAFGDGGMILTNDPTIAQEAKLKRVGGLSDRYNYVHDCVSLHSRLDEMQAAILRIKLKYLNKWTEKRREIARNYSENLLNLPIQLPTEEEGVYSVYHLFCLRTQQRDELRKYLESNEIGCQVHYPLCLHEQPALKKLGYSKGDFPVSEKYARELLSIPMFPFMTAEEVGEVSKRIKEFYG